MTTLPLPLLSKVSGTVCSNFRINTERLRALKEAATSNSLEAGFFYLNPRCRCLFNLAKFDACAPKLRHNLPRCNRPLGYNGGLSPSTQSPNPLFRKRYLQHQDGPPLCFFERSLGSPNSIPASPTTNQRHHSRQIPGFAKLYRTHRHGNPDKNIRD